MHPLLNRPRALAAYLLSWALLAAVLVVAWAGTEASAWGRPLALALPVAVLSGLLSLALYAVCRSLPLRPARWLSGLSRRAVAAFVLACGLTAAAWLWNATGPLWGWPALVALRPAAWLALLVVQWLLFMVSALVHDALLAQQAAETSAATEAQARLLARDMENKALRNQLDPHFLFNSLNSISALIPLDAAAARQMTIDLAQFFRQTLGLGDRPLVRLDEELALVQHYLAIEQRRLGERLRFLLDLQAGCGQALLPPLVLQPLVENAIKHGIRHLDDGGLLEVAARREGSLLHLSVRNPTEALAAPDRSGLGQGLRLLQGRLQAACPAPTRVQVQREAHHFSVQVTLPWQT